LIKTIIPVITTKTTEPNHTCIR